MRIDKAIMNSSIENLVPVTGNKFPSASNGELFYLSGHATLVNGLYYYEEGIWHQVSSVANVNIPSGYRDLFAPLVKAKASGLKPPKWKPISGGLHGWSFRRNAVNELHVSFHIQHDHNLASGLFPHFHWLPTTNDVGVVRFGFEYMYADGHGTGVYPNTSTTIYLEQSSNTVIKTHNIIETSTDILAGVLNYDGILLCRIFRDGRHVNDTYPASVFVLEVDCHYLSNRVNTPNKTPPFI